MPKMRLLEAKVPVVKQENFIDRRHDRLAHWIGGMTSERKVYFGESIGIEDTQLHHLSPRGTNGMARPQRFAFFRKAIANHLKPERRDHGDSLAATALQVLGHTQMKQVLIEVCHDHPICLL